MTQAERDRNAGTFPDGQQPGEAEDRMVAAVRVRTGPVTRPMAEDETQLPVLVSRVRDQDALIQRLDREMAEKDERIAALSNAIEHKDQLIERVGVSAAHVNHRLREAQASLGWRLFRPLRMLTGLLARLRGRIRVEAVPFKQLQTEGAGWLATGNDPQFLLIAERDWRRFAGWHALEVECVAAQPMNGRLFFDVGGGFSSPPIAFRLSGKGLQAIPVYVPSNCVAIRLDLAGGPDNFALVIRGLTVLKKTPQLTPEFQDQASVYQALERQDDAAALVPVNDLRRQEGDYQWVAQGHDPQFVLRGAPRKLRPGWHMVELCMRSDAIRGNAKLYFDQGKGWREADSLALPFSDGVPVERVFNVQSAPRQVRFDPLEELAQFSVERLQFRPAGAIFARNSMLRRLCSHSAHFDGRAIGQVWRHLQAQAVAKGVPASALLRQYYNDTFPAHSRHDTVSYAEWIARFETPEFCDAPRIEAARLAFTDHPTISVVMPAYNTAETLLRRAIASVLNQSYPLWELCIADDASSEPHVRAVLEEYAGNDLRIKVTFRPENGHISAASNSALALATGEYVALLDHDDELAPHALHFVVDAINRNRFAQILYSDEDKIDETGRRSEPHFKPDWNPDLFLSQNYVSHLGVYRRDLLKRIGGFRAGVEGSQDHDLLLRCLQHVHPAGIVHIPRVLYHWRRFEGSTALASAEKDYATGAGIRALEDHFRSQGRNDVKIETGLVPNSYRVRYPIPQPEPLVSLLIPTRDKVELLQACVQSIIGRTTYRNYEIIILDNGSVEPATRGYLERIATENARTRVVRYPHAFNFSAINNYGVHQARGELVGLVNNDIEVISADWLTEMVSHALRPEIGCVGAKLYYADETIQHAGVITGLGGVAGHSHKYFPRAASGYFHRLKLVQNLSAVTAACMVVRKSVYEQVGGLEEAELGIAFNDVDFCLKVREAGYRNLWTPYAELYHLESKSRGMEDTPEKVDRFNREASFIKAKWGEALRRDPCYSPHLTLAREDFSLR
jgi:glycosyltransferase involved in cell wall biosynthesis